MALEKQEIELEPTSSFELTIAQKRIKQHQVTALHLMIGFLLVLMGLVTWSVPLDLKTDRFSFLGVVGLAYTVIGFILIVIAVFFNKRMLQKPRINKALRFLESLILLTIVVYTLIQSWYLPFAYAVSACLLIVFAFYWEFQAQKELILKMKEDSIQIPGIFIKKTIPWQDISHAVFKHQLITIDCQNNHLYQFQVRKLQPDIEQGAFNQWLQERIASHSHLPRTDE